MRWRWCRCGKVSCSGLERRSTRGRVLARLARDPNRFLATIQIGIILAGFLASATAAVALAEPLVLLLDGLGEAAEPVAIVLVTLVLTFLTLILGELAPKRVAMQRAEGWAMVVDERGAVDGIVTLEDLLEDLLEEIVGEIYDETDRDVLSVARQPDGSLLLPGLFPVHDLPDVGVELTDRPGGDYSATAGLVLTLLGRIPTTPGDTVTVAGWTAEVTRIKGHAIIQIRLRPAAEPPPGG